MVSTIIPVMAAMYLGSSFHLSNYRKGNADIFDSNTLDRSIQRIDRSFTKSQYKLVESSLQAREFLDVDGALSLKIKKGDVDVGGSGAYLKETANRQNFVELLIRVQHETVTETIPSYIEPRTDWMSMPPSQVGTHFVRSITYGGELVASLRLKASNREEREKIKAAVTANLQLSGTFDLNANGSFDKLRKELAGMYNEEIKVSATKPPSSPPQNVEDLMKIVVGYPKEIQEINNGKGKALKAELYPLSSMKKDYPLYMPNSALNNLMDDVENKYDDIRITMSDLLAWNKRRDEFPEEDEEKVEDFFSLIQTAQNSFHKAIAEMDVSTAGDPQQFKKAFQDYGEGKNNFPNRFQRLFWKLKQEVHDDDDSLVWKKPQGSGTTYVKYGSKSCKTKSSSSTDLLYWGYTAGTSSFAWNGGKNSQCLPAEKAKTFPLDANAKEHITSLQFRDLKNPESFQYLLCAVCMAKERIITEIFPAMTQCPEDWNLEYSGYLMADSGSNVDRDFLCVSKDREDFQAADQPNENNPKVNHVFMNCESCEGERVVPCVVCTK